MHTLSHHAIFNDYAPGFYWHDGHWVALFHAPASAIQVQLVGEFTNWADDAIDLEKVADGKFWNLCLESEEFIDNTRPPKAGDRYKFRLRFESNGDWHWKQDPAARQIENSSLDSNSIVTEETFEWEDENWQRPGWEFYLIYQLHPKRFSSRPGLPPIESVEKEVGYIRHLGATAIELLPLHAFALDDSWGYNSTFFYALESSYGSPDDLKQLVDTCHRNGIAVILDVVYNHSGNGDNILWNIDAGEYFSGDTDWGPMINYGSDVARHFFIQNLIYLAKTYHIDGFRFDMSHIMHKGNQWVNHVKFPGRVSGWPFCKEMRSRIKAVDPKTLLIAEELPDNWYITSAYVNSSWDGDYSGPFDSQWSDAFHDNVKAVIKGANIDLMTKALNYLGDRWHCSLNYCESHDEVGNSNERIARVAREGQGWKVSQVAAAATIMARGVPMIFMGQEGGEWMQFGMNGKAPDGSDWWSHRLNLDDYEHDLHQRQVFAWYQRMFEIRRNHMSAFADSDISVTHTHNDNGVVAFTRANGRYLIVLNFKGNTYLDYNVGVSGLYKELANTSWPVFNLFGFPEATRGGNWHHDISTVPVPAFGAVILERY